MDAGDAATYKEQQRAVYSSGDPAWLARILEPAAAALAGAAAVGPGDRVLDVAAGDGNFALAAARRGAAVTATDLTPRQVELGRQRSAAAGLAIEWREADAEALPFGAGAFTVVGSNFGVMYAPRPAVAAAELFRVAAPGGRVALTAWPPDSAQGRALDVLAPFLGRPAEPGGPDPHAWGDEATVRAWLGPHAAEVGCERRELAFPRYASGEAWWADSVAHAPVLQHLEQTLDAAAFAAVREGFFAIAAGANRAPDGTWALVDHYLLVVARRPP